MCDRFILLKSIDSSGGAVMDSIRKDVEVLKAFDLSLTSLDGSKVLESSSFHFKEGDVYKITGKLGHCSEFLKMMGFLEVNYSGQLFVNQLDVSDLSFEEFQGYRLNIGYTFDFGGLLNNRTIKENILLPLQYHMEVDFEEAEGIVEDYLARFKLLEFKDLRPAMTPGYVRKLGCVIRSLVGNPQILVMDGPTTAIDKERSQTLIDIVKEKLDKKEVKMVLFSSTYDGGFTEWNPKILRLEDGKLLGLENGEEAA